MDRIPVPLDKAGGSAAGKSSIKSLVGITALTQRESWSEKAGRGLHRLYPLDAPQLFPNPTNGVGALLILLLHRSDAAVHHKTIGHARYRSRYRLLTAPDCSLLAQPHDDL